MKRKHKIYSRPKRPFDKKRIEEEGIIKEEYGLKNKREIWKAEARIKSLRERAKKMVYAKENERKEFVDKLNKAGIKVNSIGDVLSLTKEDYLKRRLQTVVFKKGLARTSKEARQLITHKKVLVDEKAVSTPSYIVSADMEKKITLKKKEKVKEGIEQ